MDLIVIVEAFLRWVETAKTGERVRAANALGRAFLQSSMDAEERQAAQLAMTYLLDDPSPQVRLALADVLADSADTPRNMIMSFAEDQLEIACTVVLRSPVLRDSDLVDLVGRGSDCLRALVAARPNLSVGVSAAIAEVGDTDDTLLLLENRSARIWRPTLRRIAERHGKRPEIRGLLLDREDLPADARHMLLEFVSEALIGSALVRAAVNPRRVDNVAREASTSATLEIADHAVADDHGALVEHLRTSGKLTPSFLMEALCCGRTELFSSAIANLCGLEDRRVRSVLATGRFHAVRALVESAGVVREISTIFADAILTLRESLQSPQGGTLPDIASRLRLHFEQSSHAGEAARNMLAIIDKISINEQRRFARGFASGFSLVAA
ncbi:DUF2336 domain-containing protein [Agrobacterium sp. ES01]|uniref:DUF2336 domain-containing protein n=1 Tax=Agrobacterium sp. ES01 TaxID=3420714 RepID=UPI003D124E78